MTLIILVGHGVSRLGMFRPSVRKGMALILVNLTTPALILATVPSALRGIPLQNISQFLLLAFLSLGMQIGIAHSVFCHKKQPEQGILRASASFGNLTYVALPLSVSLYGPTGLLYSTLFSLVHDLAFWIYVPQVLHQKSIQSKTNPLKTILVALFQPPLLALFMAFLLGLTPYTLPPLFQNALSSIGNCTIPLALLSLGASVGPMKKLTQSISALIHIALIKMLLLPLGLLALLLLIPLPKEGAGTLLLHIAAPTATFIQIVAQQHQSDETLAANLAIGTLLPGFILLPILIKLVC